MPGRRARPACLGNAANPAVWRVRQRAVRTAQHDPDLRGIRAPLSAAQEAVLWEDAVEASDVALASTAAAAALAGEAWALAHRWQIADRLRHYAMTEDTRLFAAWASDYQQRVEVLGAIDQARLPDAVRTLVDAGTLRAPAEALLVGFDELTPQQTALFNALASAGCRCDHDERQNRAGAVHRIEATDERDELERMADWVAHCLAKDPGCAHRRRRARPGVASRCGFTGAGRGAGAWSAAGAGGSPAAVQRIAGPATGRAAARCDRAAGIAPGRRRDRIRRCLGAAALALFADRDPQRRATDSTSSGGSGRPAPPRSTAWSRLRVKWARVRGHRPAPPSKACRRGACGSVAGRGDLVRVDVTADRSIARRRLSRRRAARLD